MNFGNPFKQLVERRLWPVALLLVAALVAVPVLLSKPAGDTPLPPSTTAALADDATESVVSLGEPTTREDVRAVLGARKDPFRPAQMHRVETPDDGLTDPGTSTEVAGGDDSPSTTGGGEPSPPSTPVDPNPDPVTEPAYEPTPEPTIDPVKTYDLYSLQVRFGLVDGELVTREVKRLTGLPGGTNPAALYLGLSENRENAVFLIDAGTEVVGDGKCDPSPENCQTLVMEPGETVFLTRGENQWELDLIDIRISETTDAAAARASRVTVAKGGRRALRHFNGSGGYRYSKATGTVRKLNARRGLKATAGGSKLLSAGERPPGANRQIGPVLGADPRVGLHRSDPTVRRHTPAVGSGPRIPGRRRSSHPWENGAAQTAACHCASSRPVSRTGPA